MKVTFFSYQYQPEIIDSILSKNKWLVLDDKNYELVIVLGGDGTFISALKKFHTQDVKIFLFNQGQLGFFESEKDLSQVVANDNNFSTFNYLQLTVNQDEEYYAINEFLLTVTNNPIDYKIFLDQNEFYQFCGTGCLIATSNGSTGMNRSLNGPILLDKDLFIFQEFLPVRNVNKHSLLQPIVLDIKQQLSIQILDENIDHLNLKVDGLVTSIKAKDMKIQLNKSIAKIYLSSDTKALITKIKNKLLGE